MQEKSFLYRKSNSPLELDLKIEQLGYEACEPSHHYGPAVRSHYLIHFVKRGKGVFEHNKGSVALTNNELFLIYPNEVTYYQADAIEPWEYYWFGFNGDCSESLLKMMGFSDDVRKVRYNLSPTFSIDETIAKLSQKKILSESDKIYETAKLYEILSWLLKNNENKVSSVESKGGENQLLKAAEEYMKRSYMMDMTILSVAAHIGIDRTQLYRYFKEGHGISPKQYLIDIRMSEAKKLIENTKLPIKQVAYSVGYQDQYLFSKMFKKSYGASPRNYRNIIKE